MKAEPAKNGAARLLAEARDFYGQMVRDLPWAMAVLHLRNPEKPRTWTVVAANARAKRAIGSSIEDYLRLATSDLGEAERVDTGETIRTAYEQRRPKHLGHVMERTAVLPSQIYTPEVLPLAGRFMGVVLHDVTQVARMSRDKRNAEERLNQICNSAQAILWSADPETLQFRSVTKQARGILGYWVERWLSEPNFLRNHCPTEDWERMQAKCAELVKEQQVQAFDFRMYDNRGDVHWFQTHLGMNLTAGMPPPVWGVMVDVTVQKQNEQTAQELAGRVIRAQERERKRISRDLHDSVGQYLTGLHWQLTRMQRNAQGDQTLEAELKECVQTSHRCLEEVRAVSYALHPPAMEMLGLRAALAWQAREFADQSGLKIDLDVPEQVERMDAETEMALFRAFQECLSNVRRHAQTEEVFVRLRLNEEEAVLEVKDRGVGLAANFFEDAVRGQRGTSLLKMRERLNELGGSLEIASGAPGTIVRARVPKGRKAQAQAAATSRPALARPSGMRKSAER